MPNPVIWSGQVLDPGRDVKRFEVRTEVLKQGRQMAYSRSTIVDAGDPGRVLALTEGQGASIGVPPEGLQGTSSHVMFLARGKVGPFRVEAQPIVGADGAIAARAVLHDEGNADKVITAASYVFATPDR